jgi:hypothetical protein
MQASTQASVQKHGNHSAASQVHAAERQLAHMQSAHPEAGCCKTAAPTHDAISHRAYDIYVKTGSKPGHCKQNWQQAEKELAAADCK